MQFPVRARSILLLALTCALTLSMRVTVAGEATSRPTTWSSKPAGVRLDLPRAWSMQSQPGIAPLILREASGRAMMGIMVERLPEKDATAALEALTDRSLAAHRHSISRFKLLSRQDIEVAGTPATEIYFRGKRSGETYKWIQTLFVSRKHKVYVLYSAPTNLYLRYLGDYDQLVRSIRLLP